MAEFTLVFGGLILFIASEKSFLHLSRNARRIFWYLFSCALTVWLIRMVGSLEGAGLVWVLLSATLAASVVEDEVSKKLGLTMLNIEATQSLRAALRSPEGQGKAERVMDIVSSISRGRGYTLGTKQLVGRMSGTTARLQRVLHNVLEEAGPDELNYLLCTINCPAMVEVCSRQTMDLLVIERLPELQTVTRAVLVDALQKLGLRYRTKRQMWAKEVLMNTRGLQLTYLKCYLDDGGDFHSTYKLTSHDLQGSIQQEVAAHIKAEGEEVASTFRRYSSSPGVMLKVVSDIDDTLFSSGGSWPAGIDNRYPKKCYYPGALALYTELDRCFAEKHHRALQRVAAAEAASASPVPEEAEPLAAGDRAGSVNCAGPQATPPIPVPPSSSLPFLLDDARGQGQPVQAERVSQWHVPLPRQQSDSGVLSTQSSSSACDGPSGASGGSSPCPSTHRPGVSTARSALTTSLASRLRPLHVPRPEEAGPPVAPALPLEAPPRAPTHQEGSNLVFLSARPESYKGLTEAEAYSKYFQPLVGRELRTAPSMLTGSLSSGPKALLHYVLGWQPPEVQDNPRTASTALFQTLAAKKLSRFRDFAAAWPECCFLFIGDNGQGDVLCAEVLWSSMRHGGDKSRLLACLIHKVAPVSATYSMVRSKAGNKATWITAWKQRNIHLSKSHVGIAVQAFTLGLLDVAGLHRVCAAAIMDFRRIWARYSGRHAGCNLVRALGHLQKDLRSASFYLPADAPLPPLMLPEVASQMATSAPLPPPSPARSLLGTSPPVSFHREYGYMSEPAQR